MKFIHITDPHLVAPGETLWGNDAFTRFDASLNDIAHFHGDADFCFISGDLTDTGDARTYAAIGERLKDFPLETILMIGNHDLRDVYFSTFPDAPQDGQGFAQQIRDTAMGRFIFIDTFSEPGNSAGFYCHQRLEWLARQIDGAPGDVYIAMHHPPFDIGIPYMDRIKLLDHEAFTEVALAGDKLRHIFFGHVHRAVFGTWRGVPYSALPGLNHQVPLRREPDGERYTDEPPMYGVITLSEEQTIFHYDCYWDRKALPEPPKKK